MNSGDGVAREQFETSLEQKFFFEWVADLHGRAIFLGLLGQFARSEGGAGQTVATGFGSDIEHRISDAAGGAAHELIVTQNAETENVHQRIAFETFVEINFAADRWDADAISVMCDSGNHTGEEPAIGGDIWTAAGDRPEPERVQAKLRPSAHGENVANDPANPGSCALERFDRAGVIVTFHFERDGPAVADIDHAGVFLTGLNQNVGPARRKFLQFAP